MTGIKRLTSIALSFVLVLGLSIPAYATSQTPLQEAVTTSAEYIANTVKCPQVGSIGGEWAVLGLARSGCAVPDGYYEKYYATVEAYVKACNGVLHAKKYTEYSRVIVALTAIGKDPTNVAGYNLLTPLGDFDRTVWQGLNGSIWALIALDAGNYGIPKNEEAKTQATRQLYVDEILNNQLPDGGWRLAGAGSSDADMTGMALQALAKYQAQDRVKAATDKALERLSVMQDENGGFASSGSANSESIVQVVVALCELGIDFEDARFVKNGKTLLDNLLTFRNKDGSFLHISDGSDGSNHMASEQGFYGIVAALRASVGKSSLYRMGDVITAGNDSDMVKGMGLPGKNADVKTMPVIAPGATYSDIDYSNDREAIEALAARGIINGQGKGLFNPDANMTRAEFATIVTRGLGLAEDFTNAFTDVTRDKWYAGYIGTANSYGIIYGIDGEHFNPGGTLTRKEAAVIIARAAKLLGMDTGLSVNEVRDVLAQFGDYVTIADWAQESVAFCYRENILNPGVADVEPDAVITRCEIARMLFNMLTKANLL